ncbi:MAG: LysM peptidoglycan-binding domain-containing protein [Vulcanibacillus sp.]
MKRTTIITIILLALSIIFSGVAMAETYTVKSGDTIWGISSSFGTGPTALMRANNLKSSMIYPGQKLTVPDSSTYFVNFGDTLWKISKMFGVSINDFISYNGLKEPNNLFVGQIIKIPLKNTWEAKANQIINTGLKYIGTPYEFGASSTQTKTFDCSSFVQQVFEENGIVLKRSSRSQYSYPPGRYISKSEIRRGDILFFDYTKDGVIDHVGIYYGDNKILHTYRAQGVEVGLFSSYWHERYYGAKRIIE